MIITAPTEDYNGDTYQIAYRMAERCGLTERQFYELLHCAVFRSDAQVDAWDVAERQR